MTKKHPKPLVVTGALHAIQWIWGPPNYPPKSLLWIKQLKKCARWVTHPISLSLLLAPFSASAWKIDGDCNDVLPTPCFSSFSASSYHYQPLASISSFSVDDPKATKDCDMLILQERNMIQGSKQIQNSLSPILVQLKQEKYSLWAR